jgi:hypothetical protein
MTIKFNLHWINYGAKLQEILEFMPLKGLKIVSRTEGEYNYLISMNDYLDPHIIITSGNNYGSSKLFFFENIELNYGNFDFAGYIRNWNELYANSAVLHFQTGIMGSYTFRFDSTKHVKIYAKYNGDKDYSQAGISFKLGNSLLSSNYYLYQLYYSPNIKISGINTYCQIRFLNLDLDLAYNHILKSGSFVSEIFPINSGNVSLAYHNMGFKNKFEYKIGLTSRFWSDYTSNNFSGMNNYFYFNSSSNVHIPSNATLDFFVIGKIGKATFGLTFENILNRLIYNMGVYPAIDRGGLFGVWSRFNITWTFFD